MKANEKATLEYSVVSGVNPHDRSKTVLHGQIVNKEVYDISRALRFALDNGFIVGQKFAAAYGTITGFFDALKQLGLDGRDICLAGWLRLFAVLRGAIDPETRTVGPKNSVHLCAQVLKDFQRTIDQYRMVCIDGNGNRPTVAHLQSENGENDKEIFANAKIIVSGTNLKYYATSDKITASWTELDDSGEPVEKTLTLVPTSSGYSQMAIPWNTELTAPVGTEVIFTFFLRGGKPEASVTPVTVRSEVVAPPNVG